MSLRILVIGAGLMGSQVGCDYALAGHDVTFCVRSPEAARERVDAALGLAVRAGLCSPDEAVELVARIAFVSELSGAAEGCDVILEAVSEDLSLKGQVLGLAASAAAGALLATSTSSLRVTDIGELAGAPQRTVGIHYLNPPLLMPIVEVVSGEGTAEESVEAARRLVVGTGRTPIVVRRDVHGFVWNRLQLAILRECVELVRAGVISGEEADLVVREGLARRWRHVGPLETVALGGFDTWNAVGRNVLPDLSTATALPDLSRLVPPLADPAAAAQRRDEGLIADLEGTS